MYVIREALPRGFYPLAVLFSLAGLVGTLPMFQANQLTALINDTIFAGAPPPWSAPATGLGLALLVGSVIFGGLPRVARVAVATLPLMVLVYLCMTLWVIVSHWSQVPAVIALIFTEAFQPTAIGGGFVGVMLIGVSRGVFSNEAGVGSAAIAHSAVKTKEPVTEGLVALLEPFIDTIVVCTMTALVVVITGAHLAPGLEGIEMTSYAFNSVIPGFDLILVVAVILFAFSTMITWSYYGLKSWTYLFGSSKVMDITYKLIFLAFVIIGSAMNLGAVIGFSDAMIFAMSFGNIAGLYLLMPEVKRDLDSYFTRLKAGEIVPTNGRVADEAQPGSG